jgi:hypothetical protein
VQHHLARKANWYKAEPLYQERSTKFVREFPEGRCALGLAEVGAAASDGECARLAVKLPPDIIGWPGLGTQTGRFGGSVIGRSPARSSTWP